MLVVKVGGSRGIDYDAFLRDLSGYDDVILVHGGSSELNDVAEALGNPPQFVTSVSGFTSRLTDRETMHMFNMIYSGKMNKMIVEKLQALGKNAVGLSGLDGRLLEGPQKRSIKIVENGRKKIIRGDLSGLVEKVNTDLLKLLGDNGYLPVLTPPAISYESVAINIDGDRCAASVAGAMAATDLIILSNIPGLLRDPEDETSLIKNIQFSDIDEHIEKYAQGRMKKKLLGAKEALAGGVKRVILGDARGENSLTEALTGRGTVIQ